MAGQAVELGRFPDRVFRADAAWNDDRDVIAATRRTSNVVFMVRFLVRLENVLQPTEVPAEFG
jgi:hypothetical protein